MPRPHRLQTRYPCFRFLVLSGWKMWLFSDWNRWSRVERVCAGLVLALFLLMTGICIG